MTFLAWTLRISTRPFRSGRSTMIRSVKTSRTQKCRIQYFRTVGCRQDQKPLGSIKSIHLCKKLVQCLLTFIIATAIPAQSRLLTDGIDLINKHDTRCIFLGFFEQIPDSGSSVHRQTSRQIPNRKVRRTVHLPLLQLLSQEVSYLFPEVLQEELPSEASHQSACIFPGLCRKSTTSCRDSLASSCPATSLKSNTCFLLNIGFGTALADSHDAAATTFVHSPHKIHQHKEQHYCRKQHD